MKTLSTQILTNINEDRMRFIHQQAEVRGIDIKGKHGSFKYDGCVIGWTYDKDAETLTIEPSVPFFVTEEQLKGHLHDLLGTGDLPEASGTTAKAVESQADAAELRNPKPTHGKGNTVKH